MISLFKTLLCGFLLVKIGAEDIVESEYLEQEEVETTHISEGKVRQLHRWGSRSSDNKNNFVVSQNVAVSRQIPKVVLASDPQSDNIVHVDVQEIVTEVSCPANMILQDNTCIGKDLCPPKEVCPTNARMVDGQCLKYSSIVPSCPEGFTMAEKGRCTKLNIFPADFTCPRDDEHLDDTRRTCVRSISLPPHCPCGYTMIDNACVQKAPSSLECAEGYHLEPKTKTCMTTKHTLATMVCPDGSLQHPTHNCVTIRQDPPRCPKGFNFDGNRQRCIKTVSQVPGNCPFGFEDVGFDCQMIEKIPAAELCAPEYIMDVSGTCIKEIPVPPRCPEGFHHSRESENICEKIVKEIPQCPEGTEPGTGGVCQRTIEHDMTQCCATGYDLENGECQKLLEHEPELTCTKNCFTVLASPVSYACPENTEFIDDISGPQCVQTIVSADTCTALPAAAVYNPSPRCLKKLEMANKAGHELRMANEVEDDDCAIPPPPQTCKNVKQIIEPQPYCANGGSVEGNQCVIREPIVPEKKCSVGVLDPASEMCVEVMKSRIESKCPSGSTRHGLRCLSKEIIPPNFVCPEDSETGPNGCCVVRSPTLYSAPNVLKTPTFLKCENGRLSHFDKMCVEVTKAPKELVCPYGTETVEKQCLVYAELIIPEPIERPVRPSYVCPPGSEVKAKSCYSVEKIPSSTVCQQGFILGQDGQTCEKHADLTYPSPRIARTSAVPICPTGSQIRGTSCMSVIEADIIKSCEPEYELRDNQCAASVTLRQICPVGTILTDEGCTRDLVAVPSVKIIKGCVHDVTPQCDGCEKEIKTTCTHGAQ